MYTREIATFTAKITSNNSENEKTVNVTLYEEMA